MNAHRAGSRLWNRLFCAMLIGLLIVFGLVLIRTAWMSDDAYITLRTVDNVVSGYGLTWNVSERVQAYTHPLWMLVLVASYWLTREAYYTTLLISLVLSLVTVIVLVSRIATSVQSAVGALISLILSKAFTDYSTSGLENVLTHLLLVVYYMVFVRWTFSARKLLVLSFVTALMMLNRLDALLFLLPSFAFVLFESRLFLRERKSAAIGRIILGLLPLLIWEGFSLLYYGFFVPNTYFAKLNTGISQSILLHQGLTYLLQSTRIDPLTTLLIAVGLAVVVWTRSRRNLAIGGGIVLYLLYIVWIGGDFMSGRFLSAPALGAVVIMSSSGLFRDRFRLACWLAIILFVGLLAPYAPIPGNKYMKCDAAGIGPSGVADERGCFYEGTGLLKQSKQAPTIPDQGLARWGLAIRSDPVPVHVMGAVGMYGFFAGPDKHIVDVNALADPLMARVPVPEGRLVRIGHFERLLPGGYLETLLSGHNRICNSGLEQYYEHLALITRGEVFDKARLIAIWKMNTGQLNSLLWSFSPPGNDQDLLCNRVVP